jgi:hypothetical protein
MHMVRAIIVENSQTMKFSSPAGRVMQVDGVDAHGARHLCLK